jgi:hypothetical protein
MVSAVIFTLAAAVVVAVARAAVRLEARAPHPTGPGDDEETQRI